jgi:trehalose synthase
MAILVDPEVHVTLDDYGAVAYLAAAVQTLRDDAERLVPALKGRTIWMLNSTARGGGVAELLPPQIALLRHLGVDARWVVMESDEPEFFALTKRLHNMIHGEKERPPGATDRQLYDAVSRENADALREIVAPHDILVVHDPQPLGAGALVRREIGARAIWRCHIGLEETTPATRAAWEFLHPYAMAYDECVFTAREYVPEYLASCATIIHPTIDPLSHKNRELSLHKLVGILSDSGLAVAHWPLVAPPFPAVAQRLQTNGTFAPATSPEDIGLIARPIIVQISRWDRLKGFGPLLEGFRLLKLHRDKRATRDDRHRRRMDALRLVLAGPDPSAIQDDPEALDVLEALCSRYTEMEYEVQRDVALLALPMASRKENALMVNALQRCADIVVQNSLREGFGLTVAEAMWKRKPMLGSAHAFGVRQQVRDGVDGFLLRDPDDADALALAMHDMLADSDRLEEWGRNAEHRAHREFLILTELGRWLRLLSAQVGKAARPAAPVAE